MLPSFLREQKGTLSVKMFSEKATPVRKDPIQDKDPAVRQEGNILTKSAEKTRRRIRLEGKKELPSLRDAFDAYVKAKTLTWSAASAKDIPRRFASSWKL